MSLSAWVVFPFATHVPAPAPPHLWNLQLTWPALPALLPPHAPDWCPIPAGTCCPSKLFSQNLEITIQQGSLDMPAGPSDKSASENHENCCSLLQGLLCCQWDLKGLIHPTATLLKSAIKPPRLEWKQVTFAKFMCKWSFFIAGQISHWSKLASNIFRNSWLLMKQVKSDYLLLLKLLWNIGKRSNNSSFTANQMWKTHKIHHHIHS